MLAGVPLGSTGRTVGQSYPMHPKVLLDACAELVRLTLKFDHPADAIVSRFFRDNRGLGPRERATLAETVYTVLRKNSCLTTSPPLAAAPKSGALQFWVFTARAIFCAAP